MAKLSRRSRAAKEAQAVAASIVVAGASSSPKPSPSVEPRPPVPSKRAIRSTRRSTNFPRKDANPAPADTAASPIKRKQDDTAEMPNKRPRQKNPDTRHATVESGEDSELDPAVLDAMNAFSKSKTRSASRALTPKIEVRLRSSKDMGDDYALYPGKQAIPILEDAAPQLGLEVGGKQLEDGGRRRETEPVPDTDADQESERVEDGDQDQNVAPQPGPEVEADGVTEQPEDELFVKQTQPSQPVLKRIRGLARPTPSRISSNPQLSASRFHRPPGTGDIYDVPEEEEEGVQVSSNPSTTSLHRKTINNLQAPQVRRNVTRLPSKPWRAADDDGFGYPDEAPRAKKKDTAGGISRKAPARVEKPPRPPVTVAPAPAPAPAAAPSSARAQQKSVASRTRRNATLEPVRQRQPEPSPRRSPSPERAGMHSVDPALESDTEEATSEDEQQLPPRPEVKMSSTAVVVMHQIMGRVGWTNRSTRWARHLVPGTMGPERDTPGLTNLGRELFKYLTNLNTALNKIPQAPFFRRQAKYLIAHEDELRGAFSKPKKLLTKIREERLAPLGESDRRANGDLEQRRSMVHDVLHYIMPMLVQVVWSAFSLGGLEHDAEGRASLPDEGTFKDNTLAYVVTVSHWINALMETLEAELSVRPFEDASAADKQDKDRTRESFRQALDNWMLEYQEAEEAVEEAATGGARRAQLLEEDMRIKEEQRKEEQRQEEETEQKWRAFVASTQEVARRPNVWREKWERASGASRLSMSATPDRSLERYIPPEAPLVMPHQPWAMEEKQWLCTELRNPNGMFRRRDGQPSDEEVEYYADTLQHPVEEVKLEIENLKRCARAMAREKGLAVEPWAA
ncbi:hypothetical protein QBC39DRAFT_385632 [Podospora conica]|nr:hypothetical protein QBC39DRAFT_385632 [Schizothecium conicum]